METQKITAIYRVNALADQMLNGVSLVEMLQEALEASEQEEYARAFCAVLCYLRSVSDDLSEFAGEFGGAE